MEDLTIDEVYDPLSLPELDDFLVIRKFKLPSQTLITFNRSTLR